MRCFSKQLAAGLVCGAVLLSLTACGSGGNTRRVTGSSTSLRQLPAASESAAASEAAEPVFEDRSEEFRQAVMAAYSSAVTGQLYVLQNDYDGDGRAEAYVFSATPDEAKSQQDGKVWWSDVVIFYCSAEGEVECLYGYSDEDLEEPFYNVTLYGSAAGDDFSGCYVPAGGQKYLICQVDYNADGEYNNIVLGAARGESYQPWQSNLCTRFEPEGNDLFTIQLYGEEAQECQYVNGAFLPTEKAAGAAEGDGLSTAGLKAVWEDYFNKTGTYLYGSDYYFLPADYDDDGRKEAYLVVGDFDGTECADAFVYFVSAGGGVRNGYTIMEYKENDPIGPDLYGYLSNTEEPPTGEDQSAALLTAGSAKFMVWERSAGGSGSSSVIFGVRDGKPFESAISREYEWFYQDADGRFAAQTDDFSSMSHHDYIDHYFTYDEATHDFVETK